MGAFAASSASSCFSSTRSITESSFALVGNFRVAVSPVGRRIWRKKRKQTEKDVSLIRCFFSLPLEEWLLLFVAVEAQGQYLTLETATKKVRKKERKKEFIRNSITFGEKYVFVGILQFCFCVEGGALWLQLPLLPRVAHQLPKKKKSIYHNKKVALQKKKDARFFRKYFLLLFLAKFPRRFVALLFLFAFASTICFQRFLIRLIAK